MMQKEKTVGKAKTVGTLFSGNDLKKADLSVDH